MTTPFVLTGLTHMHIYFLFSTPNRLSRTLGNLWVRNIENVYKSLYLSTAVSRARNV